MNLIKFNSFEPGISSPDGIIKSDNSETIFT